MRFRGRRKTKEDGGHLRIGRMACTLCDHYIMGSSAYVILLGLIGAAITAVDIVHIMNNKMSVRSCSRSRDEEDDVKRDLKLMTSILGIEHYTLIMLGALIEYPMLHIPWLLMQLCVIIVEITLFFVRVFLDGFHVKCDEILLAALTIHNWLQVFCLFHRQARQTNIEVVYIGIVCFTTNCLSSIAVEAAGRSPLRSSVTKSAAFNSLFRRNYNLKIKILVTDIIGGFITTILMTIGDKYNNPYLYLPWLANTITGMAFREGPTLFNLAYVFLPKFTFPTGCFLFTSFLLYVEEICIWNDVFINFHECWMDYHRHNKLYCATKDMESLSKTDIKKIQYVEESTKNLNLTNMELTNFGKSENPPEKINNQESTNCVIRPIKSSIVTGSNALRNRSIDVIG